MRKLCGPVIFVIAIAAFNQAGSDIENSKWGTMQRRCRKPFPREVEEFKTDRQPEAVWKFAFFIFKCVKFEFEDNDIEGHLLENIEKGIGLFCKTAYAYSE